MPRPSDPLAARELISIRIPAQHRALIRWAAERAKNTEGGWMREIALSSALDALASSHPPPDATVPAWAHHAAFREAWQRWRADRSRTGIDCASSFLASPIATDAMLDAIGALLGGSE